MKKPYQIVTRAAKESAALLEQFCQSNGQLLMPIVARACALSTGRKKARWREPDLRARYISWDGLHRSSGRTGPRYWKVSRLWEGGYFPGGVRRSSDNRKRTNFSWLRIPSGWPTR